MSDKIEDIPQDKLASLGEFARELPLLEAQIEELENKLKAVNARYAFITEVSMPEILMELGIDQIRLATGQKCTMTKFYAASIPEASQQEAFKWLRENGHDSIIKNKIEGTFGKGEDEKVQKLMETLVDEGFTCKTNVHAMTLKSFVKEQMEAGQTLPDTCFKIFVGNKVKIK